MKRLIPTTFSILLLCSLVSCTDTDRQRKNRNRFGYGATENNRTQTLDDDTPKPADGDTTVPPATTDRGNPPPTHVEQQKPTPPPVQSTRKDYPYAKPVEGKPGFVISPYAPYSGYVDVHGYLPGQEVACPYTSTEKVKKIFLVP